MNNGLVDAAEVNSEITPAMWALFYILLAATIIIHLYGVVKRYRASRRKIVLLKEIDGVKMGVVLRVCANMPRYFGYIIYEIDPNYAPFPLHNPPTELGF